MPIKVLDRQTIDRIAAGEVIERPASVVKELVENALDAGATRIDVEVQGGGVQLLRVADNGRGIPAAELELAFQRHATSKITSSDDLLSIGSLGFRGEALPSIAAVARVEVLTCVEGEPGSYISLENGTVKAKQSRARPAGTTFTARDLFASVPARLKFLKTPATENGHAANIVSQYALAYPGVAFTLTVEGRQTLQTSGRGRLIDAVIDVYGVAVAEKMLPISDNLKESTPAGVLQVTGLVGAPGLSRAGRDHLSFFVNRRWVSSRALAFAVEEAYRGLLMTGKHPVAVINVSLPPREVDVNIHPAKSEVKFQQEPAVFRAVQRAVRGTLVAQLPAPAVGEAAPAYEAGSAAAPRLWPDDAKTPAPAPAQAPLAASLPVLRVVGQVLNSYIVAEGPDAVYLIDQHAAHERIRYEMLAGQRQRRAVEVQGLLEPATFEITPRQDDIMRGCLEDLAGLGFAIEPFGARTYLVRAVPAVLGKESWESVLRGLLDALAGEVRRRWQEEILASVACHGAVLAGQRLSDEEMRGLVRQLEQTAVPHACPHGRPTMIQISKARLEKDFGRLG